MSSRLSTRVRSRASIKEKEKRTGFSEKAGRLAQLERENISLRKLVSELALRNFKLREIAGDNPAYFH